MYGKKRVQRKRENHRRKRQRQGAEDRKSKKKY